MPAPLIAAAIAALAPALAQKGLDLLSGAILGTTDKGVEKLAEVVKQSTGIDITKPAALDDDSVERLRIWEREHAAWLSYLATVDANDTERMRIAQTDTAGARELQAEAMRRGDQRTPTFIIALALIIMLFGIGYVTYASFFFDFAAKPGNSRVVDTSLGWILMSLTTIIGVYFGTSLGSWRKTNTLERMAGDKE